MGNTPTTDDDGDENRRPTDEPRAPHHPHDTGGSHPTAGRKANKPSQRKRGSICSHPQRPTLPIRRQGPTTTRGMQLPLLHREGRSSQVRGLSHRDSSPQHRLQNMAFTMASRGIPRCRRARHAARHQRGCSHTCSSHQAYLIPRRWCTHTELKYAIDCAQIRHGIAPQTCTHGKPVVAIKLNGVDFRDKLSRDIPASHVPESVLICHMPGPCLEPSM